MQEEGQNFDHLRRVLALKRHESPPPRYFNELPGRILARLEKEPPPTFWTRLRHAFLDRPLVATGTGVAVGCAALGGLAFALLQDTSSGGGVNIAGQTSISPDDMESHDAGGLPTGITPFLAPVLATNDASAGEALFRSFQQDIVPVVAPMPSR